MEDPSVGNTRMETLNGENPDVENQITYKCVFTHPVVKQLPNLSLKVWKIQMWKPFT